MTRGGRTKDRDGPERRCIASGDSGPTDRMIRFVLGPGDQVVPDLAAKLPGRGVWLTADRALVETAVKKRLFSRGFRTQAGVAPDLADLLERLLTERLTSILAMARKAGQAVTGFEKTKARLADGSGAIWVEARDGAADGRTKLQRVAGGPPGIGVLTAQELGLAFGRDFAIHAALDAGGLAKRALAETHRLAGFRPGDAVADVEGAAALAGVSGKDEGRGPAGPRQDSV
ncbi:MAG: RNA-binding protein [Pseudomonadota bacterium]